MIEGLEYRVSYVNFWGKAGQGEEAGRFHPLAYHSLDVAAVGRVLLERCPLLAARLAAACHLSPAELQPWLLFLLASHDLGKFADGFQALRPELMERLQGELRNPGYPERHDTVGYRLWRQLLLPRWEGRTGLWAFVDDDWSEDVLAAWLRPICGHHGRPPRELGHGQPDLSMQFPRSVQEAAAGFVSDLAALHLPQGLPAGVLEYHPEPVCRASWLVAGWATAADWIGSNVSWFPFVEEPMPLERYWHERALPQAEAAVVKSGVGEVSPARFAGLAGLWPKITRPTPLQALAESLPLTAAPRLVILEEVTGGGKTEAALVLAHRMISDGTSGGLFFALPTMATANAMHTRLAEVFRHLYAADTTPSLVLAHSRQRLHFGLESIRRDAAYTRGESTAAQDCADWLADSRKKALLAQVGVGTIDQALLAVLPVRHQSLRVLGLAAKVLIVDEVHACDAYVLRLLERLLELQASLGGSALLLSATLARRHRRALVAAFARGAGFEGPALSSAEGPTPYPLMTHFAAGHFDELPVAARAEMSRRVEVRFHRGEEAVLETLAGALEAGGCACWIRNTVGDALGAYETARARFGAEGVRLFHSRFTVFDRRRIEGEVLAAFGPASGAATRRGQLLIATQVVEQSLDLDFDVLVSDLAPVDLLIQRAGRLRRHRRSRAGDRQELDERGPVVLEVLAPEASAEPNERWYSEMFPRAAFVYEDHARLWLGARWLEERGGFAMPEDTRELIEFVYDEESEGRLPNALTGRAARAEGKSRAAKALASQNALKLPEGYKASGLDWPEDAYTPTRLGEPTVMLCLLREHEGRLVAWHHGEPFEWEQSEVQVRENQVAGEDPAEAARFAALRLEQPRLEYLTLVVLTSTPEGGLGRALNSREEVVSLTYNSSRGLSLSTLEELE